MESKLPDGDGAAAPPRTTHVARVRRPVSRGAALLAAAALLAGCAAHRGQYAAKAREAELGAAASGAAPASSGATSLVAERQLVRTGRMSLWVEDHRAAAARAEQHATAAGGIVASSRTDENDATVVVRVPAAALDATMNDLAALGTVRDRSTTSDDVTDQVTDLAARRAALAASRDRLKELLARSANVKDLVEVERELARVQGELDSLDGRLAALRGQVTLSTLTLHLQRKPVLGPLGMVLWGAGWVVGKLFVWR